MQKPSERYKLTSDNNIITFKKPVHDPFNCNHGIVAEIFECFYIIYHRIHITF